MGIGYFWEVFGTLCLRLVESPHVALTFLRGHQLILIKFQELNYATLKIGSCHNYFYTFEDSLVPSSTINYVCMYVYVCILHL